MRALHLCLIVATQKFDIQFSKRRLSADASRDRNADCFLCSPLDFTSVPKLAFGIFSEILDEKLSKTTT